MLRGCLLVCLLMFAGCADRSTPAGRSKVRATKATVEDNRREPRAEEAVDRKIVYEANVELEVRDFSATEIALPRLVEEHGGYLSETAIDHNAGKYLSGRWQARIPSSEFQNFLVAVSGLGETKRLSQSALDVTAEFVDLEARIKSKQELETRIVELLKKSAAEIGEVLKVEGELARVRSEIEQMQGKLRYLANRAELTTVDIAACERPVEVPPPSPAFLARIDSAWSTSLLALRNLAEDLAVAAVAVFPWLTTLAGLCAPVLLFLRRRNLEVHRSQS